MRAILAVLTVLAAASRAPAADPLTPQERSARETVERYLAAYAKKDTAALTAQWDADAPGYAEYKDRTTKFFDATGPLTVKLVTFGYVRLSGDVPLVHVFCVLEGNDAKTGKPHPATGPLYRVVELRPAGAGWKIRAHAPTSAYYPPVLMSRLKTERERTAFLREHRANCAVIGDALNRSAIRLADEKRFDAALVACDRAREVADFLDSLRARSWAVLHRGVVLEAKGGHADALEEIDSALAGFRREQLQEGEAVALVRRGRALVKLNRPADAVAEFDRARDLTKELIDSADRDDLPVLGSAYLDDAEDEAKLEVELAELTKRSLPTAALKTTERLFEVRTAMYGDTHVSVARTHIEAALLYAETGRLDRAKVALAAGQKVIAALYPPGHDNHAICRSETGWLATLAGFTPAQTEKYWDAVRGARRVLELVSEKKLDEALKLVRATTAVRAELCGRESVDVTLGDALEAFVLLKMKKFDEAAECHRRMDGLYTKIYGKGHSQVRVNLRVWIEVIQHRAYECLQGAEFAAARDRFQSAADLRERLAPDEPVTKAPPLAYLRGMQTAVAGWVVPAAKKEVRDALLLVLGSHALFGALMDYQGKGDVAATVTRFEGAAETLRKALGPDDPAVTLARATLVALSYVRGDVKRGALEAREVVASMKRSGFQSHPVFGAMAASLAYHALQRGDLAESGPLLRDAVEQLESAFGKDHLYPLVVRGLLAQWLRDVGEVLPAFDMQTEVVRRLQRLVRTDLDRTARGAGGFPLLKPLPAIRMGPEHVVYAEELASLGGFYLQARVDLARVEATYRHQEDVFRVTYGEGSPLHVSTLADLGLLCHETGRLAEAEKYLDRVTKALAGPNRPSFAAHLEPRVRRVRADLYLALGRYADAEPIFREVVERAREVHGPVSSVTYSAEAGLATALGGQGKAREAVATQLRALAGGQAATENVTGFASEYLMEQFAAGSDRDLDRLITLLAVPGHDAAAVETLWTWVIRRKGVILDASCRFREGQLALAADPKLAARVGELRAVQQKLTSLATHPPAGVSADQLARDRKKFRDDEARLEGELKRELARVRPEALGSSGGATLARVREKVPPGAALVEFVRYAPYDFKAGGKASKWGAARYLALVLPPGPKAEPKLIDLGEAKPIDDAVSEWRKTMEAFREEYNDGKVVGKTEASREKVINETGRVLDRLLLDPVRPHLGGSASLVLVPDGPLHVLPFAALVDEKGRYLVETTRTGYLSSTRDLLRPAAKPGDGVAVFAGPDFDLAPATRWEAVQKLGLAPAPGVAALRGPPAGTVRGGWRELADARGEADDVLATLKGGRFGRVETVVGADALEERLKALKSPRILHVATHGFFLDATAEAGGGIESRLRRSGNPLLRSGLVLAGANRWRDASPAGAVLDDGYLTAEEVALLDLRGTELVVLSACEAGLGDVRSSEGVYGLRRAFLYAGARAVVVTLEQVPDAESRELMRGFYKHLGAGKGRADSLGAAQRGVIDARRKRGGAAHPFFWASYILVGDGG